MLLPMKNLLHIIPILLLAACSSTPKVVTEDRTVEVDGNKLQIASGTLSTGRFIVVMNKNADMRWVGPLQGGKDKWQARATVLNSWMTEEIRDICGDMFYQSVMGPTYKMMDKDDTMGGLAPVLGITASMAAHLAASSATDEANVPVSIYSEFKCRRDEK